MKKLELTVEEARLINTSLEFHGLDGCGLAKKIDEFVRISDADWLRNLADRLMRVPVINGVDAGDAQTLDMIASRLEDGRNP